MSVGSAGLAVAQGAGNKGLKGGAPPGNNGTIKIDQSVLLDVGKVDHANHPHVSCDFALSFFGFDTGTQTAQVNFTAQPPSGKFQSVDALVSPTNFTFMGHGPGGSLDIKVPYRLDVDGLKANPNQGFHIKVEVEVTGSQPQASDDKFKVFWYEPCEAPPTTSTTLKHEGPTTTSTTLKHEGPTTTSTTLTPTSSSLPEKGTTTVPTTAPPTTSPPTTSKGHGNVTGTTSTTTVAPASGLAFTSGPTPSGAGTDIGFFSTHEWVGSSNSPWLLLITGGVLLAGAGGLSLKGSRLKRWMTRA